MTATAVIEEIENLTRAEQSRVIQFAFELARERQLLVTSCRNWRNAWRTPVIPAEVQKPRIEIHRGFYGH